MDTLVAHLDIAGAYWPFVPSQTGCSRGYLGSIGRVRVQPFLELVPIHSPRAATATSKGMTAILAYPNQ
jgi:hypothetical protein